MRPLLRRAKTVRPRGSDPPSGPRKPQNMVLPAYRAEELSLDVSEEEDARQGAKGVCVPEPSKGHAALAE